MYVADQEKKVNDCLVFGLFCITKSIGVARLFILSLNGVETFAYN